MVNITPHIVVIFILVTESSFVFGKSIGTESSSGVTFFGKVADRIVDRILGGSKQLKNKDCITNRPSDCGELDKIFCTSGIYTIYPDDTDGFDVFCEMEKDGGGWTVLQRRLNGMVNFYRNWAAYKNGFGSLSGEFWIGNDHLHQISSQGFYSVRVDLGDFENNHKYAKYTKFSVGPESSGYELKIEGYSGDAGNSLGGHNGNKFTTKDKDNDRSNDNCAERFKGAWWYTSCHSSNLNGLYLRGNHTSAADGVNWHGWKGHNYSLQTTTMMIKRL